MPFEPLYTAPPWGRQVALFAVPIALVLLAAANMPTHIRAASPRFEVVESARLPSSLVAWRFPPQAPPGGDMASTAVTTSRGACREGSDSR